MLAIKEDQPKIVQLLVAAGANGSAKNNVMMCLDVVELRTLPLLQRLLKHWICFVNIICDPAPLPSSPPHFHLRMRMLNH